MECQESNLSVSYGNHWGINQFQLGVFFVGVFLVFVGSVPGCSQVLVLALYSRIILGGVLGTLCGIQDHSSWAACKASTLPRKSTISLAQSELCCNTSEHLIHLLTFCLLMNFLFRILTKLKPMLSLKLCYDTH